nr:PIG-L family deacetylase [Veillonella denticariosi]
MWQHKEKRIIKQFDSSFSYLSFFGGGRRLLILVPHQDDEINTAGSTIIGAVAEGLDVHIAYMTNGDWDYAVPLRNNEAIQAALYMGISKENIHFLDYPDCGSDEMSVYEHQDSVFIYRDRQISWNTLLQDIRNLIEMIRPDAIICTGFDSHRDHRQCESCVLSVMESLWSKGSTTRLYTAFAYGTAYESIEDWWAPHWYSTKMNPFAHPEYLTTPSENLQWDKRIRIPVPLSCRHKRLVKNPLYLGLGCHISQAAYRRSTRLINSDQVYWLRGPERNLQYKNEYLQIMIDNHFAYDWYIYGGELNPVVSVYYGYETGGCELSSIDDKIIWYCNGDIIENGSYYSIHTYMLNHNLTTVCVRCVLANNPAVFCESYIHKKSYFYWIRFVYDYIINKIKYSLDHHYRKRAYKEIRKLMRNK